jgi:hypothetical protein
VERPLLGQIVRNELTPKTHRKLGAGAPARGGEQTPQQKRLARRAQAELAAVAGRALGLGHLARQAGAFVDQPQKLGVDGVDARPDSVQRWRFRVHFTSPLEGAGP